MKNNINGSTCFHFIEFLAHTHCSLCACSGRVRTENGKNKNDQWSVEVVLNKTVTMFFVFQQFSMRERERERERERREKKRE